MQQIREIISTKSSKIAIRKNLDPRNFSPILYIISDLIFTSQLHVGPLTSIAYSMHSLLFHGVKIPCPLLTDCHLDLYK